MMQSKRIRKIMENLRMQINFLTKILIAILQNFHFKTTKSDSKGISCHKSVPWFAIRSALQKRKLILKEE